VRGVNGAGGLAGERARCDGEVAAIRRGVSDPDVAPPTVAIPTVVTWLGSIAAWTGATAAILGGVSRGWLAVTIPLQAFVTFSMFTVLHESAHHAVGRSTCINEVFGRLSMPFVSLFGTFPMLRFIHMEHHRNTNEDIHADPDAWNYAGPRWQVPLRWLTIDAWYCRFYAERLRHRPRNETAGFVANLVVVGALLSAVIGLGYGWQWVLIYLIPQRIGLGLLAWWFDWLPHHDLAITAKIDRFRATRLRVGWERVMTPLLFYQNYHLVHHIHPAIPFYLYVKAWKNSEADYLERNIPINTAWGRELTPSQYRSRQQDTGRRRRNRAADPDRLPLAEFHRLRIAEVRALTARSVLIGFDVPDELAALYRFQPGQNVVVRACIDGRELRRTYSICAAAGSKALQIAVKEVEAGRFSRHANRTLQKGAELEVMPPSGQFILTPAPAKGRTIAAIAAGSGITPIISILASALPSELDSRAALLYANHDRDSVMFGRELAMLARGCEGRLRITHFISRCGAAEAIADPAAFDPSYEDVERGRLTADRLASLLVPGRGELAAVDEWYVCAPPEMTTAAIRTLKMHGVPDERIHRELFVSGSQARSVTDAQVIPAKVTLTLNSTTTRITTVGDESLLQAALRAGLGPRYSCSGGVCGSCKAKVLLGNVHMEQNFALASEEIADGWILTCQSRPTTDALHVDYDR
jgi:ferredoxin-NADP reductase/fatty acid desaturase